MSCMFCGSCSNIGNRNFLEKDIPLGIGGMTKLCEHVSKYEDTHYIDLSFEPLGLPVYQIQRAQPIYWCPMCGRNLGKEVRTNE